MRKKFFIWGKCDDNDRVLMIKEYLKKSEYIIVEDKSGNIFNNLYFSDIIYIPPMMHKIYKSLMCKILKKRVICDIYAPLYDTTVNDYKKYKKFNPIAILHFFRDYFAMTLSNPVLFLNESEATHFTNTICLDKNKINYAILPLYRSEKQQAKLPYYKGKSSMLTLCWTGSFVPLQGVEKIIETAQLLKSYSIKFRLLIIGPNNKYKAYYQKMVKDKNLNDEVIFPNIWGDLNIWEELISNNCDISLGIFGDSQKAKNVVANKVVDATAFGIPIITGYSNGLKEFFDCKKDIMCVDAVPLEITKAIIKLSNMNIDEISSMVNRAYKVYTDTFNKENFIERIKKIIDETYK